MGERYALVEGFVPAEVADVEGHSADEVVVADLEVEPVGVAAGVGVDPHVEIELVSALLDGQVQVAALEV